MGWGLVGWLLEVVLVRFGLSWLVSRWVDFPSFGVG